MTNTQIIGKIGITPRGAWDPDQSYGKLDLVSYEGSSYLAKQNINVANNYINNENYWFKICSKGADGASGRAPTTQEINTAVTTWLESNLSASPSIVLDRSLTSTLSAAPADMVGIIQQQLEEINTDLDLKFYLGGINDIGGSSSANTRIRSEFKLITSNFYISIDDDYEFGIFICQKPTLINYSGSYLDNTGTLNSSGEGLWYKNIIIPIDYINKYFAIRIRKLNNDSGTEEELTNVLPNINNIIKIKQYPTILTKQNLEEQSNTIINNIIKNTESNIQYNILPDFESGAIASATGNNSTSSTRIRSKHAFFVPKGTKISYITNERNLYIFSYDQDNNYLTSTYAIGWIANYEFSSDSYIKLVLRKNESDSSIYSDDWDTIINQVIITNPRPYILKYESNYDWVIGKSIRPETHSNPGATFTNTNYSYSSFASVSPGDIIVNEKNYIDINNMETRLFIACYNDSTFVFRKEIINGYTIPSNINNIRFIYGYNSDAIIMKTELLKYFIIKIYKNDNIYYQSYNKPVYISFGASTTNAAMHSYNATTNANEITYSKNNYPDYIGKILNLDTYNLGVGGAGFLSRSSSTGDDNIMDQIYNNDSILQRAKLITLMFGYGNDHYPDNSNIFPIGNYTDYYPYDEDGYHPSDRAGITEMLNKGATFMGCLNWCIKWINEHYPYAQLILIFGSPSANEDKIITINTNNSYDVENLTSNYDITPKTITFTNPYAAPSSQYGDKPQNLNQGIYLINEQLQLLKTALNIPIINLFFEGNVFSQYSMFAKNPEDDNVYALFSMKKDWSATGEPIVWNSHPNNEGYEQYAKFIAGKVISLAR